jgi:metallophosphoesterase superfamily enzyme
MIKKLVHFSDLHIRLFKDHDLYRSILMDALNQWKSLKPDRIIFSGDLLHSKNQLTPELINVVSWLLKECSYITKTIIIPGNHDALINNLDRLDSLSPIIESLNNSNIVYYKDIIHDIYHCILQYIVRYTPTGLRPTTTCHR